MEEERIELQNDYLPMVNSNKIEAPNDRVLFNTNENNTIKFRNVKNNEEKLNEVKKASLFSRFNAPLVIVVCGNLSKALPLKSLSKPARITLIPLSAKLVDNALVNPTIAPLVVT